VHRAVKQERFEKDGTIRNGNGTVVFWGDPPVEEVRRSPEWRALLYFVCPTPEIDFRLPGYTPSLYCQQTLKRGWAANRPIPARPLALLPEHAIFRTCSALEPESLAKLREVSIWFLHYVETEFWHTLRTSLQYLADDAMLTDCYDDYDVYDEFN
jgi:hypothetical protein